jgi:hypothetical protein
MVVGGVTRSRLTLEAMVSRVAAKLPLGLREVVSSRRSDSDKRCEYSGKRLHGADEIMAIAAKAARRAVAGRLVEHL